MMSSHQNAPVVMIADDNLEARRMLETKLKHDGYEVVSAENGRQAIERMTNHPVDLAMIDLCMPDMDGFTLLGYIKATEQWDHIPVIMISGGCDQEDQIRSLEMGAIDCLAKPFNAGLLRARIRSCIATKRQRDQERQRQYDATQQAGGANYLNPRQTPTFVDPCLANPPTGPYLATTDTSFQDIPLPRLDHIQLERPIGSGGMCQVYLGHHTLLNMPVAVKLPKRELFGNKDHRERFLREARMAVQLSDPHVVRLFGIGEYGGGYYLTYEYITGGTLENWLEKAPGHRLDISTTIRITSEIAKGLAAAQMKGIIHRDLKPNNILMCADGKAKIADLGVAKQYLVGGLGLTAEHLVIGTPMYMAPEQIEGVHDLDTRTDLYALGGILHEMLVGVPPFLGESALELFWAHVNRPVPPPSEERPEIPFWLDGICLKLLSKHREDRYQTPQELIEALLQYSIPAPLPTDNYATAPNSTTAS